MKVLKAPDAHAVLFTEVAARVACALSCPAQTELRQNQKAIVHAGEDERQTVGQGCDEKGRRQGGKPVPSVPEPLAPPGQVRSSLDAC